MDEKYYDIKDIKKIFESYRQEPLPEMNESEYEIFCDAFIVLPKEILNTVHKEIQFVSLRYESPENVVNAAYHINLEQDLLKGKKGIILLTPYVIGTPEPPLFVTKNGRKKKLNNMEDAIILHEVAHHILGHTGYKDKIDKEEIEKAADKQVEEWIREWKEEYFKCSEHP